MARTRMLKPGFFTNDTLASVHPLGRLLFAGLWGLADREGRLPDRPRRIKAEVLPYDRANVDGLLDELASRGFIDRYAADGDRFIAIRNFSRHQTPHVKEPPSTIPAPDKSETSPMLDRSDTDTDTDPLTDADDAAPPRQRHKPVDEEFLEGLAGEYPEFGIEGVREELAKARNRKTWDGFKDKRQALRNWMSNARKFRERDAANGRVGGSTTAGAGFNSRNGWGGAVGGVGPRPGEAVGAFPVAKRWPPDD